MPRGMWRCLGLGRWHYISEALVLRRVFKIMLFAGTAMMTDLYVHYMIQKHTVIRVAESFTYQEIPRG